ncbi:hypothetical protein NKH18_08385 [Streptomyces sp. M10(2022)]
MPRHRARHSPRSAKWVDVLAHPVVVGAQWAADDVPHGRPLVECPPNELGESGAVLFKGVQRHVDCTVRPAKTLPDRPALARRQLDRIDVAAESGCDAPYP